MRHVMLSTLLFCLTLSAGASDWTQWFGPNHDGSSDEKIATKWPTGGPKVLWKVPMGDGLGTPVVADGKVYIMSLTEPAKDAGKKTEMGGVESVLCLDAATGKTIWTAPAGPSILHEHSGNDGPRSTPAVDGGYVYALSTYLILTCYDAKSGSKVWSHDCPAEFGGTVQLNTAGIKAWGCANSPVIDGNLVFVHAGGKGEAFLAFDKKSGKLAWKGEDDELTHCTPTVCNDSRTAAGDFLHEIWFGERRIGDWKSIVALCIPVEGVDGDFAGCGRRYRLLLSRLWRGRRRVQDYEGRRGIQGD